MKIVVIGPESTGKTTLAQQLAIHFKTTWVEEYARQYIEALSRPYEQADLLQIAKRQIALEEQLLAKANQHLICDTDLIVLKIWSEFKYGCCDPWILNQIAQRQYDLYLLCGTDVPWEYDPQREHPHLRQQLYDLYKQTLLDLDKPFVELKGGITERLKKAVGLIENGKLKISK